MTLSACRTSVFSSVFALSTSLFLYLNVALASLPLVDFDRMGKVGLAGTFAGLDFLANSSDLTPLDSTTATLLFRSSDGALSRVASTNSGGNIVAGCVLDDTLYLGGSFTSVGSTAASNIASFNLDSQSFSVLGSGGPNGEVKALFCDTSRKKIWVGGSFSSPSSSVAVWDVTSSSWSSPPFGGLAGSSAEVTSITTNSSQSSLFFAGSFVTSFGNGSISLNGTNNPNVPFSAGATPFSSSLVPVPLQNAQIDASPPSSQTGFNNITNVLCPGGPDGSGNTWLARDGSQAFITVRKFSFLSASGIRIGNTFLDGRGTTGFSVTTIPDNTVQTLHYTDPRTGANQTCSDLCPLLTDSSILYQDFLFDGARDITGFQLTLSQWQGSGPGIHLLQLLSSGAFASSIVSDNGVSCFAPNPSNASRTGTWTEKDANTAIPGTVQAVLVSDVAVGTPSAQSPAFTWMPYVSASGQYTINILVPGCTDFQDCPLRTSVKVTVFPGDGLAPFVTTVTQRNTEDAVVEIYNGPVVPSSQTFVATITMSLADNPEGTGQNGQYELVADRVQLILNNPNITANASNANSSSSGNVQSAFGFFEYPLASTSFGSATGVLANSSQTALDTIGVDLFSALGGTNNQLSASSISAVAHHSSGTVYIAGDFKLSSGSASGASNIVAFSNGALSTLANSGLNGAISSLAIDGDKLFVGGAFTDTASTSTQGKLRGVAIYDIRQNQWSALDGGVDGAVASLGLSNDQVLVAGNFTKLLSSSDGDLSRSAAGLAVWNVSSSNWVTSGGFLVGDVTFVSNGTLSGNSGANQVIAGHISTSLEFGASGFVMLQNGGDDGVPHVTPLSLQLGSSINVNSSTGAANIGRRSHIRRAAHAWIPRIGHFFKRQSSSASALAPLPSTAPATAPAILAGAFWTNSSSSKEVAIIGGNFSVSVSGSVAQNLALYDADAGTVKALQGNQVNGSVRTLLVQGNSLYVGGTFSVQGTSFAGFAVYDLSLGEWDATGVQALQSSSGSAVVVRSITASPSQANAIIVAGSFAQAGSQPCRAICSYDTVSKQWSALGNGIQGDATTVAYAGDTRDLIIVAGSLALADSTTTNVAKYTLSNGTWSTVGDSGSLPGPVTALEVNNANASSIFAAGRASDETSSYLSFWNGLQWISLGLNFERDTDVSQLIMVPLQNTHSANSIIESDRMLLLSGTLADSSFGNASSALFDGEQFIPYIVSSSSSGAPGIVSSLIHSFSQFSFTQHHFLATGVVILISIAISAGVVFLLALIAILWTLFSRREDKMNKFDPVEADDDDSTHRPSSLLEHINAATRTTIIGGQSPFSAFGVEKEPEGGIVTASERDPFAPDASNYVRAETPSDAIIGTMAGEEEVSRPAHARYSFDGDGEGELRLMAGQDIEVLDDRDPAWWYARDTRSGREGVVPAAYVY